MNIQNLLCVIVIAACLGGCGSTPISNASGVQTKYLDPTRESTSVGVGIESNDIGKITDKMVRSLLNEPLFSEFAQAPRIIVDSSDFRLEGNTRINRKIITTRIRNSLTKAAKGKMVFVARHALEAAQKERRLKREGLVDGGTIRRTDAVAGADFKLIGSILTTDERHSNGMTSRYHYINFELMDLEMNALVWADNYEFKKTGADDVAYR